MEMTVERISELRTREITHCVQQTEDRLSDMSRVGVREKIQIIGVPEREENKGGAKKVLKETTAKNSPNLASGLSPQIIEAE